MDNFGFLLFICSILISMSLCVNGSDLLNSNSSKSLSPMRKLLQAKAYAYNRCSNREKEWMNNCDVDAAEDWDIVQVPDDIDSRSYCCYVWDSLSCKLKIARKCDNTYASQLEKDTETKFNSLCYYHSRRSASCALRWWSIMLIVIGGILLIALVVFCVWRGYQNKYKSRYDY